jgi:hypothetical protein
MGSTGPAAPSPGRDVSLESVKEIPIIWEET